MLLPSFLAIAGGLVSCCQAASDTYTTTVTNYLPFRPVPSNWGSGNVDASMCCLVLEAELEAESCHGCSSDASDDGSIVDEMYPSQVHRPISDVLSGSVAVIPVTNGKGSTVSLLTVTDVATEAVKPVITTDSEGSTISVLPASDLVTTTLEPIKTGETISTKNLDPASEPFPTKEPISTEEPTSSEEPTSTVGPTTTNEPTPSTSQGSRIPDETGPVLIPPPPRACPTPTCQPGIEKALFSNPFKDDTSSNYDSFNPSYFKTQKPLSTEITDTVFISDDGQNKTLANAALEYRGFLFACQTGTYNFTSPYADDITIMWFGPKAYEGWTRDNADITQTYYGRSGPITVSRTVDAETYIPIRIMWGNTGGAADLKLTITGPDGRQLGGSESDGSDYLVTEACDGSYQPFPPFGSEP